jgi:hypothetical protein
MNKFFDYILFRPTYLLAAVWSYIGHLFSEETYLKVRFRLLMGKWPDLKTPKTFNEKLQWLKLHDRRPEYTAMVDKYAVKSYVARIIGEEFIIPTYGVWDRPEDIEWEKLPNQFVLKTTHGGGSRGVIVCKDKKKLDKIMTVEKLQRSMKSNAFKVQGEWPYNNVPRRIIAEKYIEPRPNVNDLPDYKWYCFNGEPKYCQVIQGRSTHETIDFFDTEWKHQDFIGLTPNVMNAEIPPLRPKNLDMHIKIARELSKNIPFSRIDLYDTGDKTYFGEITLYPIGGFGVFHPSLYNEILGQMLNLPKEI